MTLEREHGSPSHNEYGIAEREHIVNKALELYKRYVTLRNSKERLLEEEELKPSTPDRVKLIADLHLDLNRIVGIEEELDTIIFDSLETDDDLLIKLDAILDKTSGD